MGSLMGSLGWLFIWPRDHFEWFLTAMAGVALLALILAIVSLVLYTLANRNETQAQQLEEAAQAREEERRKS